ncbi:UNVERIFIED_CONTAM: energy-coupling factor transporter ATPase [Clostridioides difficile]|uniref:energy-coupling factor transporter ATPase n=1 Tax=Clostridioides difficile TaxID=1496 RepID=UPI00038D3D90|nr:energy-coupling factor transporter ATPase [Clostridioides difficile]EQE89421.1 ABC transporter family protein [Clostridioides difficile CD69]HBF7938238.1 energy-coupling factor transporter ATPase [Clostridioides difficile]HBG6491956.1 energy-coupling factor transporter ATPase [Clostridioides difficile]HBY2627226.1 energy-coupling factor transporter ATPase [Clostridioides difficile]HBY3615940.1 energy-coupling factor transporter ATPase [Clostridioides difficile]
MSIIVKNLTHIYNEGMPFASKALDDVSFEIKDRDFVGLIGHTGSGKSTLIQHLNGLLKPSLGEIFINDFNITDKNLNLTEIRKRVGVVFQYPEYQLFEETIDKDIAFGPSNLGLEESEIHNRVKASMEAVGLDYEEFKDKSPFELSGGQKRRVAIAGVIAMNPEVLILDEPTAGLDPGGRDEIFNLIKGLHEKKNMTIILSSHSMDDMAKLAKTLIVMNHGSVEFMGTPREVFKSNASKLKDIGLDIPQVLELALKLREKGFDISEDILTLEEAKQEILKVVRGRGLC